MITNPTPLTAEDVADEIYAMIVHTYDDCDRGALVNRVAEDIKAYAAQQNAELMQQLNNETTYQALQRDEIEALKDKNERLKQLIDEYQEALIWCSGSADFQIGGIAREGWEKIKHLLPQPTKEAT